MTRLLPFFLPLALLGCRDPGRVIGEETADDALLTDVPGLAFLSTALGDEAATVADLFDEDREYAAAPDPTGVLTSQFDAHAQLDEGTGTTLSVLTYNAGLLGRNYLFFRVEVPELEVRWEQTGPEVFAAGDDIVFLQEVWERDYADSIGAAAQAAGYTVFTPEDRKPLRETGLLMAVRSDLIDGEATFDLVQYDAQFKSENFPGPNIKRGYLHATFTLAGSGEAVHLFDTHTTPFSDDWRIRNLQVRELGLAIAVLPDDALVLVGGDFNAGWYYSQAVWVDAEGNDVTGWWNNPSMPALLGYYSDGLQDLANLAELVPEVQMGNQVPTEVDETWLDEPFGDAALCDQLDIYTATDCDSLYLDNYAATEFPARMDLLWVKDGTGRVRARSRERAFVQHMEFETGAFELSDHYGQRVAIELVE